MDSNLTEIFSSVKQASRHMGALSVDRRNEVLLHLADALEADAPALLDGQLPRLVPYGPQQPPLRQAAAHT